MRWAAITRHVGDVSISVWQTEAQYVVVINDQNSFHGNGHLSRNTYIFTDTLHLDSDAHSRFGKHPVSVTKFNCI